MAVLLASVLLRPCWLWPVLGCTRWPASTGGCSRRSRTSAVRVDRRPRRGPRVRVQASTPAWSKVVAPPKPGRPVELVLRIDERLRHLVRTDAVARIISEGLVGAKVVELFLDVLIHLRSPSTPHRFGAARGEK